MNLWNLKIKKKYSPALQKKIEQNYCMIWHIQMQQKVIWDLKTTNQLQM